MIQAADRLVEQTAFDAGVERINGSPKFGDKEIEHYTREAGNAEAVEWVEKDDCCIVAVEVCYGVECRREDGVGYNQVQQGGFASSCWVVGGWW